MSVNCFDKNLAKEIAKELLSIGAIKLQPEDPFTWASGWQSPIYCDNRLSLSFPALRTKIKESLADMIRERFPNTEVIAGVATAGIPQGALVAEALGLPMIYVRSKSKGHGLENQIEGKLNPGQKVIVVEDLVSTGGSSLKAVEALRASGAEIEGMVSIFTYDFNIAREAMESNNVNLSYLSDYPTLIEYAAENGLLKPELVETLNAWREDPGSWGK
ncbi:MAG: orotate phosphoribosyltransferase [Cytophagales bacterium]|nr:orotate phosphoribosyltransferase [Cytophagales bacterium]